MPQAFENYLRERRTRVANWLLQQGEAVVVTSVCKDGFMTSWTAAANHSRGMTFRNCRPIESGRPPLGLGDPRLRRRSGRSLTAARGPNPPKQRSSAMHSPSQAGELMSPVARASSTGWDTWFRRSMVKPGTLLRIPPLDHSVAMREQRTAFVEFLMGIVEEANDAPDRVTEIPPRQASMASIVEQFLRTGSFQEVWQADAWPVLFCWSDAFEILRRATPEQFIKLIEELPHPTLVKQCLNSRALAENPGEVLGLLRFASPSFDIDGRWQRNGMTAILLLQLASAQLLSVAKTQDNDVWLAELPAGHAGSQAVEEMRESTKTCRPTPGGSQHPARCTFCAARWR